MKITTINPQDISGYRGNRFEDADQNRVEDLIDAITARGFEAHSYVIVVDGDVANGRHRALAAAALGMTSIPAIEVDEDAFLAIMEEVGHDLELAASVVEYHAEA